MPRLSRKRPHSYMYKLIQFSVNLYEKLCTSLFRPENIFKTRVNDMKAEKTHIKVEKIVFETSCERSYVQKVNTLRRRRNQGTQEIWRQHAKMDKESTCTMCS